MSKIPSTFNVCPSYNIGKEYICPLSFDNVNFQTDDRINPEFVYSEWFKNVSKNNTNCLGTCNNRYNCNCKGKINCTSEHRGGGNGISGCGCNNFPIKKSNRSDNRGSVGGVNPEYNCNCKCKKCNCNCNGNDKCKKGNNCNCNCKIQRGGGCGCLKKPEIPMTGGCVGMLPCLLGGNKQINSETIDFPRNTCKHYDSKNCGFIRRDRTRTYDNRDVNNRFIQGNYFDLCAGNVGNRPIVNSHDNNLKISNVMNTSCPNNVGRTMCQQPFWTESCI